MEQMEQIMEFDLFEYFNRNKSSIRQTIKSMNEYQIASNSLHRISARSTKSLKKNIFHR